MTPGSETSEFSLARIVSVVGAVVTACGVILAALAQAGYGQAWVGVAIMVIGALTKVVTALGYSDDRSALKAASIEAGKQALVAQPPRGVPGVLQGMKQFPPLEGP